MCVCVCVCVCVVNVSVRKLFNGCVCVLPGIGWYSYCFGLKFESTGW